MKWAFIAAFAAASVVATAAGAGAITEPAGSIVAQAEANFRIDSPAAGTSVSQGTVSVRGVFGGGSTEQIRVVYAIDVSGSTSSGRYDCNNDGVTDSLDDLNGDGRSGNVLDCEIGSIVALNTHLSTMAQSENVMKVGLVAFGDRAAVADVVPGDGTGAFTTAQTASDDRDRRPDIVRVAASTSEGRVREFTSQSVGTGTSFDAALAKAFEAFDGERTRRVLYLLSDGESSVSEASLRSISERGIEVRTFAVGDGAECGSGRPLQRIALAGGGDCTFVSDPTTLRTAITGGPVGLDRIEVRVGGISVEAEVNAVGHWTADVEYLVPGTYTATATAYLTDGSEVSEAVTFRVGSIPKYVALGDSYTAGAGLTPYLPGTSSDVCMRGIDAFPRRTALPGWSANPDGSIDSLPRLAEQNEQMVFAACSGAVIRHLVADTIVERGNYSLEPAQLSHIGADTDFISLTIGGNDAGFAAILIHCATQKNCMDDGFARLDSGRDLYLEEFVVVRLRSIRAQLEPVYRAITDRAPNAIVVVANYPEFFDDGRALRLGCKEGVAFGFAEREFLNGAVRAFSAQIESAAGAANVGFVDVIDDFRGNRICEGKRSDDVDWLVGHETILGKAGNASFHPNYNGHDAYSKAFGRAFAQAAPEGAPGDGHRISAFAATPVDASDDEPYEIDLNKVPDLTAEELSEVESMEFGTLGLTTIGALRGGDECLDTLVPRQQVLLRATGFAPGSKLSVIAASEGGSEHLLGEVSADELGGLFTNVVIPASSSGNTVALTVHGTTESGAKRRVSQWAYLEGPGSECARLAEANGELSDGGLAPGSVGLDGVPATILGASPDPEPTTTTTTVVETTTTVVTPTTVTGGTDSPAVSVAGEQVNRNASDGRPLASTGGSPWLLVVVGAALVSAGGIAMRLRSARRHS